MDSGSIPAVHTAPPLAPNHPCDAMRSPCQPHGPTTFPALRSAPPRHKWRSRQCNPARHSRRSRYIVAWSQSHTLGARMGGCFSSGAGGEDDAPPAAAAEGRRRAARRRPSDDEDGRWPYVGERDVDKKAAVFIEKFHRHQSAGDAAGDQQNQQPPADAAS
ncbi:hypothetical protein ACP4OV_009383 [Aristida adscensionis]